MHHGLRGMHAPVLCLSLALSSRVASCLYLKTNPGMLILVLVLKDSLRTFLKSLSLSWSLGSGPCPYPGPCGLVLVLVFSPCKYLFPLFHYFDLFAYYCSVNAYN